jgi:hypothetical protein
MNRVKILPIKPSLDHITNHLTFDHIEFSLNIMSIGDHGTYSFLSQDGNHIFSIKKRYCFGFAYTFSVDENSYPQYESDELEKVWGKVDLIYKNYYQAIKNKKLMEVFSK